MYFSEKGNVDDDATLITIFLVSFNLQSCCLMQSAVCSLQMSYTVKLFSVRHICHILYPREDVLNAQGINVSDVYSDNAFSLFSCMWTVT